MVYVWPNQKDSKVEFRARYQNFIGGEWTRPVKEQYFENVTPVTGKAYCEVPRSTTEDVEKAIDAAFIAKTSWAKTAPAERALFLQKLADRIEQNIEKLAIAETWDSGRPIRDTLATDLPLTVDCFRYFASCLRADEGTLSELDEATTAYRFHEPYGVVGLALPWSYPLLSAAYKLAPALAAGNAVCLTPAAETPASILLFMDLVRDLLPPGLVNVVTGYGTDICKALASNKRIGKLAFCGETSLGQKVLQWSYENMLPVNLEIGGKSSNLFFEDCFAKNDEYVEKCLEGFTLFAQGRGDLGYTASRCFIDAKIFSKLLEKGIERARKYVPGNPLDPQTTVGALASNEILDRTLHYIEYGKREGAKLLLGGDRARLPGDLANGYYMTPTIFQGTTKMKLFQEETFGPVLSVCSFRDYEEGISFANDTRYACSAGVWTRDMYTAYRAIRNVNANRVWANGYHLHPAHATFSGYNQSSYGLETSRTMLDSYQQIKNLLISYDTKPIAFF